MDIDKICNDFFEGKVKPKHLTSFEESTPKGNKIRGYINQKPNQYLGSILITHVNDEETNQFIHSMPKLHYVQHENTISNQQHILCFEKLDGTCLILYPLKNNAGEIIEIVPKTRGRAVADSNFTALYNKINKKPIQEYYKNHDGILLFELYGVLNQHEIIYYETGIDIRLIGIYEDNKLNVLPTDAKIYGFKKPELLFSINYTDDGKNDSNKWFVKVVSRKIGLFLDKYILSFPTILDAIDGVQKLLEEYNDKFYEVNNRYALEGVVMNTNLLINDCPVGLYKIKPSNILNKCRAEYGVPRSSITKEVLKYFDEYGSSVQEIYNTDKKHHTEYIHRMLSEEYDDEFIKKSAKKIEKIFMQIWDSRQVPFSIHNLCDDLINNNPDKSVVDLMRIFSMEYPMKKKQSRLVYSLLDMKLNK